MVKVKELKEILSKLDDDVEVVIDLNTDEAFLDSNIWLTHIRDLYVNCQLDRQYKLYWVKDGKIAQRPHPETKGAKKCLVI